MPDSQTAPDRRRWGVLADSLGYATERVGELLLTALIGVLVARYLGPRDFGLLSYAGGVFGLLVPIAGLGLQPILVREFVADGEWRHILASAVVRQAPVALGASIVGFVLVGATREWDRTALLLGLSLAPIPFLAFGESLRAYLEARQLVRRVVTAGIVAAVVASSLRLLGVVLKAPVWVFGGAATLQALLALLLLARGVRRRWRVRAIRRHYDARLAGDLVRESWPLLLAGVAVTVYMRADIIMLGLLADDTEAGVYAAAARLSEVWYFLPMAALAAVRPRLATLHAAGESEGYRTLLQRFMTSAVAGSIGIVVVVLLVGDALIRLLYGTPFADAGTVLRFHILAAPFVFLGVASGQWFIDKGLTRAVLVRSSAGALLNVAANLALIPVWGARGAAVATLIAYSSGVLLNALPGQTRELFRMQVRALRLAWGKPEAPDHTRR